MEIKIIEEHNDREEVNISNKIGEEISITGLVYNIRLLSWGGFIILRTSSHYIQCVFNNNNINTSFENVLTESTVKITGIVKSATIKDVAISPRDAEIEITSLEIISSPSLLRETIDITKKELKINIDTKFDNRPYTLRHPSERAIFKIQSVILNSFSDFLSRKGFTRISSPKIVFSGAEGGSNVYKLDYFGREAYLAQSPQFYKQMMVGVFGKVYETGSVFRAEKHNTSRHLNEYVSLDLEMQIESSFTELIDIEVELLKYIFNDIRDKCKSEIELLNIEVPELDRVVVIPFANVHQIVYEEYGKDYRLDNDLAPEEERLICEFSKKNWGSDFVFVTHFPSSKRPFYTKDDPEDPTKTLSFDLLFKGIEVTTGGQRLNLYDDYLTKMNRLGLEPEKFESYLQAFKVGMPPHGGLALGLERVTAIICNLSNIKEASLFPRDINRLEP
ncbi:aspartate--tRNA(Asn) ligase [Elizabethkingia anophelis]|nr:aspartate--tRNA(Asn) ligase [Elizabethkingia anophelis]